MGKWFLSSIMVHILQECLRVEDMENSWKSRMRFWAHWTGVITEKPTQGMHCFIGKSLKNYHTFALFDLPKIEDHHIVLGIHPIRLRTHSIKRFIYINDVRKKNEWIKSSTRWFKVTALSPSWRSLNLWRGHLTIPKRSPAELPGIQASFPFNSDDGGRWIGRKLDDKNYELHLLNRWHCWAENVSGGSETNRCLSWFCQGSPAHSIFYPEVWSWKSLSQPWKSCEIELTPIADVCTLA